MTAAPAAPAPGELPSPREARLARVCAFVDAYLDVVVADDSDRGAKAACELALFARHLAMRGVRAAWARGLGARLVPRLRGVGIVQRLLWSPSRAGMLGAGHGLLRQLGHPAPAWDTVIERLIRHRFTDTREVSPYEALEVDWVLGLLDRPPRGGPRPPTLLDRPFDPLVMHSDDAYAFTHAVFYATDFGRRPLPAAQLDEVAARCDAGAAWSVARADLDLAGEFVLAACCAGAPLGPSALLALAVLLVTWDELGFVPDDAMAGLGPTPGRDELFFAIYHANLVAGLVVASLPASAGALADGPAVAPRDRDAAALRLALGATMPAARAAAAVAAVPARCHARAAAELAIHQAMQRRDLLAVVRAVAAVDATGPRPGHDAARAWLAEFAAAVVALELPGARDLVTLMPLVGDRA